MSLGVQSTVQQSFVTASDGILLSVFTHGDIISTRETVLAIHGYPDNHHVWDYVADLLTEKYNLNFVSYDVRGSGESGDPANRDAYLFSQLISDIECVIDSLGLTKVHLLGHDWGSIQSWPAVIEKPNRFSSFTTISGPDLNLAGKFLHAGIKKYPVKFIKQVLGSLYIPFFLTPKLPEIVFNSFGKKLLEQLSKIGTSSTQTIEYNYERTQRDYINGINLYRANMPGPFISPHDVTTNVPVQILVPSKDFFVTPAVQISLAEYIPTSRVVSIEGGHWLVTTRPDIIARLVAEWINIVETTPINAITSQKVVPANKVKDPIYGKLALITGGGSGIGRATALELAKNNVGVIIIADRDIAAAQETVDLLKAFDISAFAYEVDISNREALVRLAKDVQEKHGVVDLLINNAGIGMAGRFLETCAEAFDRIVAVNLEGVVNGCREFGRQMVERGQGGTIINIASASAFLPSKVMVAYSTTKSAVLGFTESLRPDFADDGIKVTVVCPGFVNTNIAKNTAYEGMTEEQQSRAREKASKAYARRNYTPEKTAKKIIKAIYTTPPVAVISSEAKLGWALRRISPILLRTLAKFDIRLK